MQTTLLARIGASRRTSASGQERPVKVGVPNGCSAISRAVISSCSPSMETNATPSGLAIRPRRIRFSLVAVASAAQPGAAGRHRKLVSLDRGPRTWALCEHGSMPMDPTGTVGISVGRRWSIVVVSLLVTASAFIFINGVAFLIPALEEDHGTPLAEAGLLSSMPSFGMVATLILWGYLLDRVGERIVLTVGSALTAVAAFAATTVHTMVSFAALLFVGGMAAASCNSAGGRLVSGWFPPEQRGLAMGVRQTAQPLGIALGALVIPELAERSKSATWGMIFPAVLCAASAVLSVVAITDPPRKEWDEATEQELANPYRGSWVLRRIHAVSALLMVPQTVTVTFMLIWLIAGYW